MNIVKSGLLSVWHGLCCVFLFSIVVPIVWLLKKLHETSSSELPSVVFGATPLINSKYHSSALQMLGIDSVTVVRGVYLKINKRQDFDIVFGVVDDSDSGWYRWYTILVMRYVLFTRLLWQKDVFFYYFDGFYLKTNRLFHELELRTLKLLGKKIVALPYGTDVTTVSTSVDAIRKYVLVKQYPLLAVNEEVIKSQVNLFTRFADVIIGATVIGPEYLPRVDYLCSSHLCIDEQTWTPHYGPPRDIHDPMRVLHAPNHRFVKGTQFLIDAIEQLQLKGLNIELILLEGVQNDELKQTMADSHIIAEQFVMGWHGLFGLEGMALGKPVLCYLRPDIHQLYTQYSFFESCPIVNTSVDQIEENLRWLYEHPEKCEELGRQGRRYVERFHSLEAMGGFFKGIIQEVWHNEPFDADEYWRQRQSLHVSSSPDNDTSLEALQNL